ncbi:hypothetical protein KFE25_003266 [Diacronema lutheri]|uniref:Endonuclease/exonuclease/phosphatase domain-containing protein n=1 Tax=Diacronema lutheri TaxID=2081491 RepID=A0A8J5XHF5_DIALT|nr:hypothetical protein KFE25_003266 [Diacronema lutheri]
MGASALSLVAVGVHLCSRGLPSGWLSTSWRASLTGLASAHSLAGTIAATGVARGAAADGMGGDDRREPEATALERSELGRPDAPVSTAPAARLSWQAQPRLFRAVRARARLNVTGIRAPRAAARGGASWRSATVPVAARAQRVRLRLLHWNILEGAHGLLPSGLAGAPRGGSVQTRLDGIARFIRRGGERGGAYDVVSCNELNGFTDASWASFGRSVGLPHTALLDGSRYRLGLISRLPIVELARRKGAPFAHGLLCVRVLPSELHVCVTHLDPHSSRARALEAAQIAKRAAHSAAAGRSLVVLGDLNTLSPLDRRAHAEHGLVARIASGPRSKQLAHKFLTRAPPTPAEAAAAAAAYDASASASAAGAAGATGAASAVDSGGGTGVGGDYRIDYAPMQRLLDAPLRDLGALTNGGAYTVPTSLNADAMHFVQMRLDFCLINQRLAALCRAHEPAAGPHGNATRAGCWAQAVVSDETSHLSDHFPLDVRLNAMLPAAASPPPAPVVQPEKGDASDGSAKRRAHNSVARVLPM